ncbi:MAG: type II secretion system ATPase GspE [Nitrospinae bacterium]|nr:type II secretion system ATPase GspE [Nitrospinota bacterium]
MAGSPFNALRLGELLIKKGLISAEELERALEEQKVTEQRVGRTLVVMGFLTEIQLLTALAQHFGVPFLPDGLYPDKPLEGVSFPVKYMKEYGFAPLKAEDNTLTIVMADPSNTLIINELKTAIGYKKIEVYLGAESDIAAAIDRYYGEGSTTIGDIVESVPIEGEEWDLPEDDHDISHLRDMALEAPVIRIVNLLISRAIERGASDVHIEPFEGVLKVRYRIDGILHDVESPPKRLQDAIISRVKIMSKLNIAERRLPQDGRIKLKVSGRDIDLRVSTVPTLSGESVVMRILDSASLVLSLEKLGFSPGILRQFESLVRRPYGIVLVTGPTGSGKTTTLYAALDKINSPDKKIITIEDPVEYNLRGINQIQVKPAIGLTFANGLRSIVRQDPDIIMIGEIRDPETAEIAIQSALTGHLVFSTIHTNDAAGGITRLLDMGMENYLLASSIMGILAQRLVRVNCQSCKRGEQTSPELLQEAGLPATEPFVAYEGAGCEACDQTGYRGRIGIFELLPVDEDIRVPILEKTSSNIIKQQAVSKGMVTLRADGLEKVRAGLTSIAEVLRVTQDEEATMVGA